MHQYAGVSLCIHGDRFHPGHLIKRAIRICSSDESYQSQVVDLSNRFLSRGYKPEWVDNAVKRVCLTRRVTKSS